MIETTMGSNEARQQNGSYVVDKGSGSYDFEVN